MKKRIFTIVLLVAVLGIFASCNGGENPPMKGIEAADDLYEPKTGHEPENTITTPQPLQKPEPQAHIPMPLSLPLSTNPVYSWVMPPDFGWVAINQNNLVRVELGGLFGIADLYTSHLVVPPIYDSGLWNLENEFIAASRGGLWGIIDREGREILPFTHTNVEVLQGYPRATVTLPDGRNQLVELPGGNTLKDLTIGLRTMSIGVYVGDGIFIAHHRPINDWQTTRVSLINVVTAEEVPAPYPHHRREYTGMHILNHEKGLLAAQSNGKWGAINKEREVILPFDFDSALFYRDGLMSFSQNGLMGIVDMGGKIITPPMFTNINLIGEGRAIVWNEGWHAGVLDIFTGDMVTPFFLELHYAGEGLAVASIGGDWENAATILIDIKTGREIAPFPYAVDGRSGLPWFVDGFSVVMQWLQCPENPWHAVFGLIYRNGTEVLPLNFQSLWHFYGDLYVASKGQNQWGIINTAGQWVLPPVYDSISGFWHINNGQVITPIRYGSVWINLADEDESWTDYHITGGFWGFVDRYGQIVIQPELEFDFLNSTNIPNLFNARKEEGDLGVIEIHINEGD
ncbi:MAG: WG repeat-containing protein [Defluviitaleaceae bacterium]|nr:WG repeat-containing protein [Defluviitaleaceae bacterium]